MSKVVDVVVDNSSVVDNQKRAEIGVRMKAAREALGLTQEGLAKAVGGSKRGIQENEARNRVPGGEVVAGMVELGINANWLLTGEGPMRLADLNTPPAQSQSMSFAFDQDRLEKSLEAVEAGLAAADSTMPPAKKAAVVMAVYDLLQEPSVTRERILKLIKFAA